MGRGPCDVGVGTGHTQSKCVVRINQVNSLRALHICRETVTGNVFLDMLEQFLEPQLISDGIMDTVVFQQGGAPPHFAITVRDYLNQAFPGRWLGRAEQMMWPPRSTDLTPLDFLPGGL